MNSPGPCAGDDTTCGRCGYPTRRPPTPPEQKIRIRLDDDTRPIWEAAKQAADEVAKWPAWKANECRCTPEELSAFMAEIIT